MSMSYDFRGINGEGEVLKQDVYASRRFMVETVDGEPVLVGLAFKQPIEDGINLAVCGRRSHSAPDQDCTCGFYAFNNPKSTVASVFPAAVDAVVRLSGKVVVCKSGFRAEKMEIVAVSSPRLNTRDDLALITSAPSFESRDAMFHEFPITELEAPEQTGLTAVNNGWAWLKRRSVSAANWFKSNWGLLLIRTLTWIFILFCFGFLMVQEAAALPEGYKEHSLLLTAVFMGGLLFMARAYLPLAFALLAGLIVSGSVLVKQFMSQIVAANLEDLVVLNLGLFSLVAFLFLVLRLYSFVNGWGSPLTTGGIQSNRLPAKVEARPSPESNSKE